MMMTVMRRLMRHCSYDRIGARTPGRQPAAAERLKQAQHGLQACKPHNAQIIFGQEQSLLGLQHGDKVDGAFAQPRFGELECAGARSTTDALQALALGVVGDGDQRLSTSPKAGEDGSGDRSSSSSNCCPLREFQLSFQPEAVEYRLRHVGGDLIEARSAA